MTPTTLAILTGTACTLALCAPGWWKITAAVCGLACGINTAIALMGGRS